jgi:hypothetical protein
MADYAADDALLIKLNEVLSRQDLRKIALRMMMLGYSLNETCERMARSRESVIELLDMG